MDTSRVGQLNPSQLLYTYGVGAIVDLPQMAVVVLGLDDWTNDPSLVKEITEPRLLHIIRNRFGSQVQRLVTLPVSLDDNDLPNPFDEQSQVGVPVVTFPRWLVCPYCRTLARVDTGLFELKPNPFHPDRTHYEHVNCNKPGRKPTAVPARFLVACEKGHLDDFPWIEYAHFFQEPCSSPQLSLIEYGPSGEARELQVKCLTCGKGRVMAQAFGKDNREKMPLCTGRRPHLRDYEGEPCPYNMRTIVLGASNLWFPVVLSSIAVPAAAEKLALLVEEYLATLKLATSLEVLTAFHGLGQLGAFSEYSLEEVWAATQQKRAQESSAGTEQTLEPLDLLAPEWRVLAQPNARLQSRDFRLRQIDPPAKYRGWISKVVLVERLREVKALVGFTRIDAPGELADVDTESIEFTAPLSRSEPKWLPAVDVRGEGIFLLLSEDRLQGWLAERAVKEANAVFWNAHTQWRKAHGIESPEAHFPGIRYVLLHTLAHVLMRQFAIECGYTQASIRERIYARGTDEPEGPMAGILIYTAAPDSEGTLGGLVSLAEPEDLERHIESALEDARLCSADPTCAEHQPSQVNLSVNGAACHNCLFAPETSCERGNRYLDRAVLVDTIKGGNLSFFS